MHVVKALCECVHVCVFSAACDLHWHLAETVQEAASSPFLQTAAAAAHLQNTPREPEPEKACTVTRKGVFVVRIQLCVLAQVRWLHGITLWKNGRRNVRNIDVFSCWQMVITKLHVKTKIGTQMDLSLSSWTDSKLHTIILPSPCLKVYLNENLYFLV